jgi:tripartite-type tricarboxylate transporter receptor subunit TctC
MTPAHLRRSARRKLRNSSPEPATGSTPMPARHSRTSSDAVKGGSVKLLGVASETRTPQAPDVPTFAQLGLNGMLILPSVGILAPVSTPKPIVALLAGEIAKAVHHPDTLKRFASLGIEPVGNSPDAYAASLKADIAYYAKAVKLSGAKND